MNASEHPAVADLVPHSGRMLLLDRVVEHTPESTTCTVEVDHSRLFCQEDGSVPAWLAVEYMAQCAAAHGGLAARARGEAPHPGLVLGSRRLCFRIDAFPPGQTLFVTARSHRRANRLVSYDCAIRSDRDGVPLAEGRLNIYIMNAWSDLGGHPHGR